MELIFKLSLVSIATILYVYFIWFLFTHQIDVPATFRKFFKEGVEKSTEFIETIDLNSIYQNGQIVGIVNGEVKEIDGKTVFSEILDRDFKTGLPFEYRRNSYKVIRIETAAGLVIGGGGGLESGVLRNVICEKLD